MLQASISIVEDSDAVPELWLLYKRTKVSSTATVVSTQLGGQREIVKERDGNGPWGSGDDTELVGRQCRLSADRPS